MANIDEFGFLREGFNQEEDMDVQRAELEPGIVDIQTSESAQEDLGEDLKDGSSVLESSSNTPDRQVVPSISSAGGQTGMEVPQPGVQGPPPMHTSSSVSVTHNVGTIHICWFVQA